MLEWRVPSIHDTGFDEDRERVRVPVYVQLVASLPRERQAPVRSDLRGKRLPAEERERTPRRRAARKIEMEGPLALSTEVQAPRRMEERGQLGEPVTAPVGRDAPEFLSNVLGARQRSTPSNASRRCLTATPADP